jgi:rRNA biogenesis protein RRP5
MARIVTIRPLELIVALPNQLYGHIPATSISVHFTKALNALAGQDSDDSGSDSDSESSSSAIPTLSAMFSVGQYISAAVSDIKTADASRRALAGPRKADEEYRKSRRVELSINPATVHDGMTKKDLIAGLTLTAAVQSLEDNGYVLDLGVEGVTSFVSSADAAKANGGKRWILGQPVPCRISKMSGNGRTCAVSIVAPQDDYIVRRFAHCRRISRSTACRAAIRGCSSTQQPRPRPCHCRAT